MSESIRRIKATTKPTKNRRMKTNRLTYKKQLERKIYILSAYLFAFTIILLIFLAFSIHLRDKEYHKGFNNGMEYEQKQIYSYLIQEYNSLCNNETNFDKISFSYNGSFAVLTYDKNFCGARK